MAAASLSSQLVSCYLSITIYLRLKIQPNIKTTLFFLFTNKVKADFKKALVGLNNKQQTLAFKSSVRHGKLEFDAGTAGKGRCPQQKKKKNTFYICPSALPSSCSVRNVHVCVVLITRVCVCLCVTCERSIIWSKAAPRMETPQETRSCDG